LLLCFNPAPSALHASVRVWRPDALEDPRAFAGARAVHPHGRERQRRQVHGCRHRAESRVPGQDLPAFLGTACSFLCPASGLECLHMLVWGVCTRRCGVFAHAGQRIILRSLVPPMLQRMMLVPHCCFACQHCLSSREDTGCMWHPGSLEAGSTPRRVWRNRGRSSLLARRGPWWWARGQTPRSGRSGAPATADIVHAALATIEPMPGCQLWWRRNAGASLVRVSPGCRPLQRKPCIRPR